jgi:hypothetical protein
LGIPSDKFSILLSHTPEIYRQAALADFNLLLSGHTHGGQICLPGDSVLRGAYGFWSVEISGSDLGIRQLAPVRPQFRCGSIVRQKSPCIICNSIADCGVPDWANGLGGSSRRLTMTRYVALVEGKPVSYGLMVPCGKLSASSML